MSSGLASSPEWATFARDLGMQLRRLRALRGLTQDQMAERADISLYAYQQYERGSTTKGGPATNPRLATIVALCHALEVDMQELLPPLPAQPTR